MQYGKRPVFLFSIATNIIILATAPLCTTSGTYTANRILLGFFGSPVESLAEISVTDVWFVHERPKYMAFYGWSLALTGKLAPMLAGFINVGMGWEWTLRVSSVELISVVAIRSSADEWIVVGDIARFDFCVLLLLHGRDEL